MNCRDSSAEQEKEKQDGHAGSSRVCDARVTGA